MGYLLTISLIQDTIDLIPDTPCSSSRTCMWHVGRKNEMRHVFYLDFAIYMHIYVTRWEEKRVIYFCWDEIWAKKNWAEKWEEKRDIISSLVCPTFSQQKYISLSISTCHIYMISLSMFAYEKRVYELLMWRYTHGK